MNTSPIYEYRIKKGMTLEQFGARFVPAIDKSTAMRWQRKVPAERVVEVELVTGISRRKLRPDLFAKAQPSEQGA